MHNNDNTAYAEFSPCFWQFCQCMSLSKVSPSEKVATSGRVTRAIGEIKIGELFDAIQSTGHWLKFFTSENDCIIVPA